MPLNHRHLKRGALGPISLPNGPTSPTTTAGTTTTTTANDGGNGGNGANGGQQQQSSSSVTSAHGNGNGQQTSSPTTSPVQQTTSSKVHTKEDTTSPTAPTTSPSQSTTATSSPTILHSSSIASKSSTAAAVEKTAKTTPTNTNGDDLATALGAAVTTSPASTVSASGPAVAASSSVNVGAVVGGIAGGLAALAIIYFVCMFLIRRKRARDDNFDALSFRKSAVMVNEDPFNPRPPTMIERHVNGHNVAPSISSMQGAGMAGAGAYSAHGHGSDEGHQYSEGQAAYEQPAYPSHQPLQPRQQYTFGQAYGQSYGQGAPEDGEYNGAYSEQPQAQDIYAAEAYAYPNDVVVSPGMHSQEMGHYQQAHDAYGGM
uniref:Uncharacterized protein n=1 Tax=Mycena chlorophos TaxID=658473 RepID=A0ABQ0LR09_MYCCL|nr:predicted protein [Mycena chlorophos]